MDAPTGPDKLSTAFTTAVTSPGGAVMTSEGSPGTKNISVISANQALTDYNNMGTFANTQIAQNYQQQQIVAANKAAADAAAAQKAQVDGATKSTDSLTGAITGATNALNGGNQPQAYTSSFMGGDGKMHYWLGSTDVTDKVNNPGSSGNGTTKTTASGNSYTSTGDPYNDQLAAQSADNAAMYAQTTAKLNTAATTAGLSVDQQQQITNLGTQYDALIKDQQNVNDMTAGQNSMAMARSGGDRYAPAVAASVMSHVMSAGVDQITSIQNKKTAALQQMTSGFESDNVKAVQDAYKAYQDFSTQQNKIINDMQSHLDSVAKAAADQKAADLNAQKVQMTFNKDNNITSQFYQYPGSSQVFSSQTGQPVTQQEYLAQGGSPDFKSIQVINNTPQLQSAAGKEYQDYLATLPAGQKALSFSDYQTQDSNRKATRVTNNTVTYNQAKDQAQTQAASTIGTGLAKKVGSDGYVSPKDFKGALAAWVSDGYAAKDFYDQFKNYINPADTNIATGVSDYGAYK